jgi:hypothetical protein
VYRDGQKERTKKEIQQIMTYEEAVEKVLDQFFRSFLRRQESSVSKKIWTPAFAGLAKKALFQEPGKTLNS